MHLTAEEFGKFDYISAHGLISWIPEFVREKTFSVVRQMLTEKGVGYISYNVYPGWISQQMMRGIARIHTKELSNPVEKIENAASFAKFLAENAVEDNLYKLVLQEESKRFFIYEAPKLFHDNLAEINKPFYFSEFVEFLDKNQMQFLAESQLFTMSIQKYSPEAKKFFETIDSLTGREQYIDFFTGRMFRQSLFCRKEINLNRNLSPQILDEFYLSSRLCPLADQPDLLGDKPEKFVDFFQNEAIDINNPLTKTALYLLGKEWGNAVRCKTLLESSKELIEKARTEQTNWTEEFIKTKQIFLQIIFNSELIEFHTRNFKINIKFDDKPEINQFVRWQISEGDIISAPFERSLMIKDPIIKKLIELTDGTNSLQDLIVKLAEFINSDERFVNKNQILETLPDNVIAQLRDFAFRGIFVH